MSEFIYCFDQSVKKDYFASPIDYSLSLSAQVRQLDEISQGGRQMAGLEIITEINAHAIKTGRIALVNPRKRDKEKKLRKLCENILGGDSSIRFAGIANHLGVMLASSYRPGLVPLMTKEETTQYALEAVTRALLRETFQSKIGRLRYAIGVYEKLIRATIAVSSGSHHHGFYLLLSFDTGSDAAGIIESKILHIVKNAETE